MIKKKIKTRFDNLATNMASLLRKLIKMSILLTICNPTINLQYNMKNFRDWKASCCSNRITIPYRWCIFY